MTFRLFSLCIVLFVFVIMSAVTVAGEVDVVDVKVKALGQQRFDIAVTLLHDDTGWDHYANAWEVLDEQGNTIGVRVLYHPHVDEQPFTRRLTVSIPESVKVITLRGKDSVHGDGGLTMTIDLNDL